MVDLPRRYHHEQLSDSELWLKGVARAAARENMSLGSVRLLRKQANDHSWPEILLRDRRGEDRNPIVAED